MNLNPLPKDVASLLQKEALAVDDEMTAAKARVRAKLTETLGAAAMAESLPKTPMETLGEATSSTGVTFLKGKAFLATVAFAAGSLTGAGIHALAIKNEVPVPAVTVAPVMSPNVEVKPSLVTEAPSPPEKPRRPAQTASPQGAWLLLNQARTALSRGQPEEALQSLKRHAEKYPNGDWTEEREALRVQALVASGKALEAHEAGNRFLNRYPESLFRGMVEAALSEATP